MTKRIEKPTSLAQRHFLYLMVCVLGVSGCASDSQQTRAEGIGAGVLLGAIVGGLIGDSDGAKIGAVLGGVAGGVIGDGVADKKEQYTMREDELNASAARAKQIAQEARKQNDSLAQEVVVLKNAVERVRNEKMSAQSRNALVKESQQRGAALLSEVDQRLREVRSEISRQQAVLQTEERLAKETQKPSSVEGIRLVNAGMRDLQNNERSLERTMERAKAQLRLIDTRRAY